MGKLKDKDEHSADIEQFNMLVASLCACFLRALSNGPY